MALVLLCYFAAGLVLMMPAYANATQDVQKEAEEVFEALLSNTDNPLVAQLALESLQRLKTLSEKQETPSIEQMQQTEPLPDMGKELLKGPVKGSVVEIPITKLNNYPMVPVLIENQVMANFLIDTGATYTVISPELAKLLNIKYENTGRKASILTGNGPVEAPLITIKNLQIGEYTIPQIKAIIHSLGNQPYFSGLLGLNVFADKEITYKRDRIVLKTLK